MTDEHKSFWFWVRYSRVVIILFCLLIENPLHVYADPTTFIGSFLISLAVSAAATAAQFAVTYLLTPKPKPIEKDKLSGDIKVTAIGEDVPIPEIYGGRMADGLGGFEHGGVIVWASPIRKEVRTIPGGGGGKGAPRAPATQEYHYYQSYCVLAGRGPLNVLEVRANTDTIYSGDVANPMAGDSYEAENATLAGGAASTADASCSNGHKVTGVGNGGTITFTSIQSPEFAQDYDCRIYYKAPVAQDYDLQMSVNGQTYPTITLPNPGGTATVASVHRAVYLEPGVDNVIVLSNPDAATADIDRIVINYRIVWPDVEPPIQSNTTPIENGHFAISGVFNPNYVNPTPTYDNLRLVDPVEVDTRPLWEWNYQPKPDADGVITAMISGAESITIYPGTATQPVDPTMQEFFNYKYPPSPDYGSACPAYRNRCIIVVKNLEITKYSGIMPNFVIRSENAEIRTLGALFKDRAKRCGLVDAELDFTDLDNTYIRGFGIMSRQSPATEMAHLSRVYDVDVFEDVDGVIKGVIPDETIAYTIPAEELEAKEGYKVTEGDSSLPSPVTTIIKDEIQLPKILSASYYDVSNKFEVATVNTQREYTVSDAHETFDTQSALSKEEAQRFVDRELQKLYAEKDALSIDTFYKHAQVTPTQLIQVTELDGNLTKMRVKAIEGWIPGALKITGTSRNLVIANPRIDGVVDVPPPVIPPTPIVPANVIGTIIDGAILRTTETSPGIYVAACLLNQQYRWAGATLFVERADWEQMYDIPNQAIMGRTVPGTDGTLPIVPVGYKGLGHQRIEPDVSVTLTLDLFWGDLSSTTGGGIDERVNTCVVGEEFIQFETVTRVDGYPNRWELSYISRSLMGSKFTHTDEERFVLMNNAVRYIPLDYSEIGKTRNYRFVGAGQVLDNVSSTSFTYTGKNVQTSGRVVSKTADYEMDMSDGTVLVDCTSGDKTITLPSVDLAINHEPFTIKKIDSSVNSVIIQPVTTETAVRIDGKTTYTLDFAFEAVDLVTINGQWYIK